jgi:hypothetical protein
VNRYLALVLSLLFAIPTAVRAQPELGGIPTTISLARQWDVTITAWCVPHASTSRICATLLGSQGRLEARLRIRQNFGQPGIHFIATYTLTRPAPPPGAGLVPHGKVCAFGLGPNRRRFVNGVFETSCAAYIRGDMITGPGAIAWFGRRARLPQFVHLADFWIIEEHARVPASTPGHLVDPLGHSHYPIDTRIPVTGVGIKSYGTNVYLGILRIPGFPVDATPLPPGVHISVTLTQLPLVGGD